MAQKFRNVMGQCLSTLAKVNPTGEYIIHGETRVTWGMLNDRVNRLANAFSDLGIKKGDKVTFIFRNCPEFAEVNYALQKLGAIPVPMNYRFSSSEVTWQADHCDAVAFVFGEEWRDIVLESMPKLSKIKNYIYHGEDTPEGMISYSELLSNYAPVEPDAKVSEEDLCVICYTGGTTGFPKGVMLTYANHIAHIQAGLRGILHMRLNPQIVEEQPVLKKIVGNGVRKLLNRPVFYDFMAGYLRYSMANPFLMRFASKKAKKLFIPSFPLFHDASYNIIVSAPMTSQYIFVFNTQRSYDPQEVCETIEREKVEVLANVPTAWKILLNYPEVDRYDFSSVELLLTGTGVTDAPLKKKILKLFPNAVIIDVFGQTEMTPGTTMKIDEGEHTLRDRSVGKPIVDTRIVDEEGNDVERGQVGEIIYRGDTLMKGYYKDPEKTSEVIRDGWFHSGDLGYFDELGEIRVVERLNECISSGGEKIYPFEVEQLLIQHPDVKDSVVIGVPDEKWGNSVRAVIILRDNTDVTEKDVIDWCSGKIAGYKKPKSCVFVDDFPRTPVGKVQRSVIKEKYGK